MNDDIIIASALWLVIINAYVTVRLLRNTGFSRFQKAALSIFIWVIPLIGALLLFVFITDDETPKAPRNPNDGQGVDGMPGGVQ
jgi:hypothetical protein